MPRNPISAFDRTRIVVLRQQGLSMRDIARQVGRTHSDVIRTWNRFQESGNVNDRPRSGRPRSTTAAQDRYLQMLVQRHNGSNANELRRDFLDATGVMVTTQTVRNRIHSNSLRSRRVWRGPKLTPHHRAVRYQWARNHEMWNLNQWHSVLFTDEVRICLTPDNNRQRVWRRPGNEERLRYSAGHVQQGGGSMMFWGGIFCGSRTPLVPVVGMLTAVQYRDTILIPFVEPFRRRVGHNFILQDDNARPHRAQVVNDYLNGTDIARMDWPAMSPDMNPVEHAWDQLKRAIRGRRHPPESLDELRRAAIEEWDNLPQQRLDHLVDSMPRRIQACRRARGGTTRY